MSINRKELFQILDEELKEFDAIATNNYLLRKEREAKEKERKARKEAEKKPK
jgi:hypothetical protein